MTTAIAQRPRVTAQIPAGWQLAAVPRAMAGFAYGYSYPSIYLTLHLPPADRAQRAVLAATLRQIAPDKLAKELTDKALESGVTGDDAERPLLATAQWFAALCNTFAAAAGLPVIQKARILRLSAETCAFAVPMVLRGLAPLGTLIQLTCAAFRQSPTGASAPNAAAFVEQAFEQLIAANLTTSNTPRLVKAAVESGIAWQEIPGTAVVQYGLGRKAAMLDSTFTHQTPTIGARFARNKHEAATMLRRNRIPVPDHVLVRDEAQALAAMRHLGFPLVVKPADCDGGIGVRADLRTEKELREAFHNARKVSARVLVEKFFAGRDYRVSVFRGQCIWAVERQPAGVTGNGTDTILRLVEGVNQDPRRGEGPHSPLKRLKLDEEATDLLARDGLSPDSVPETGRFVRLRRSSNISSGGMPEAVFDRIHPDNAVLAIRAARALKLDLAGIDLLIPDISVSWKESGAAICEVNGQPEFGGMTANHIYPLLLKRLTGGNGHIPVVSVAGGPQAEELGHAIAGIMRDQSLTPGVHSRQGITVGNVVVEQGTVPQITAGQMLAGNTAVSSLVFCATNAGVIHNGFPVPSIDLLILTGEPLESPLGDGTAFSQALAVQFLQSVKDNARQIALLNTDTHATETWVKALDVLAVPHSKADPADLLDQIKTLKP